MKNVKIKIYRSKSIGDPNQLDLVRTLDIEIVSDKPLTASSASKILKRELPEFVTAGDVLVIKTGDGWQASRSFEPSEKCDYHYIWEYAVVINSK